MDVVHRDITPRNVMVDEEGQVKVIDFGIAAPSEVAGHEVFGSPGHMPPEQIAGDSLGPPTDIFAVAATLLEACGERQAAASWPKDSGAVRRGDARPTPPTE